MLAASPKQAPAAPWSEPVERRPVGASQMTNLGTHTSRRAVLTGIAASLGIALPPRHSWAAADAVGVVKQVQGSAFLKRGDGQLAATAGADILAKDVAATGD